MNAEKKIRLESRRILSKNNWGTAAGVFFMLFAAVLCGLFIVSALTTGVYLVIKLFLDIIPTELFTQADTDALALSLSGNVSLVGYPFAFAFVFPIYMGVKRYFYLLTNDGNPILADVLYYYTHNLKKNLGFSARLGINCGFRFLLCIAPAFAVVSILISNSFYTGVNSLLIALAVILFTAGIMLWIMWTIKYYLCIYIYIENNTLSASECVKISANIMSNNLCSAAKKLIFSFFGWYAFSLTGIGLIFTVPYFECSVATSAKWMIKLDKDVLKYAGITMRNCL